jgi:hypothetical protein
MALALKEYAAYVTEMESGEAPEAAAAGPARARPRMTLEHDSAGFPMMPERTDDDDMEGLEYQKRVIRSFLTDHYRACSAGEGKSESLCAERLK